MTKSTYEQPLPGARGSEAAVGHRPDGTAIGGRWHTHPEMAAAGLWTTPSDLARFAIAIREASQGGRPTWLSQARARDMLTTQIGGHGLGPGVSGEGAARRFGHGGSNVGYRCTLEAFVESGDGIAVMTNSDRGSIVAGAIIRTAAAEYGWPGLGPIERTPGTSDPAR